MSRRNLLYIGNKLSKKGSTVTSIETLGTLLEKEGFVVRTASSVSHKMLRMLDMLWKTLRYAPTSSVVLIDTYSTQNFYYAVAVARLCRMLQVPYIPILRGGDLPQRLKKSPHLSRKLFTGAKTNVCPSQYLLEAFKTSGYKNLTFIPNTLELDQYPFVLRKEIQPRLLWVRSFSEIYHPKLALDVLEQLITMGFDAQLCMVGPEKDGSLERCKAIARDKGLPVIFTGLLKKEAWVDRAKEYDIFINTTNFDNTPVSVLEAMALGLPVISTNVGGIPHLLTHEEDALLVPPNDANAFTKTVVQVLADASLASKLSRNGRAKVTAFDWQVVKQAWVTLLNQ
ncbi:glycosyltransferase family 4 protein [Altibacter sp.]|uniref:glycosyltransferase family 4 protein n=1 Tax=Altibacter sp. TaxID=2024823 RepID=UPI000C8CFCE7|nr:glycosyltransferase family 4 protein [Altibacter sp.]MAP54795.1 glycosyl transferase family 1 [Altibacter sp.]